MYYIALVPSKNPPLAAQPKRPPVLLAFPYPESTPCAFMSLKTKHCPFSQAGRRRFDPGLPLHCFSISCRTLLRVRGHFCPLDRLLTE
jgi:hypothetical protein